MKQLKNNAIVDSTGHFVNEIDMVGFISCEGVTARHLDELEGDTCLQERHGHFVTADGISVQHHQA